jgi:hypothetical protein
VRSSAPLEEISVCVRDGSCWSDLDDRRLLSQQSSLRSNRIIATLEKKQWGTCENV